MLFKRNIKIAGLFSILVVIFLLFSCRGFMKPAPIGVHGQYSLLEETSYKTNNLSKDSILKILMLNDLSIKEGRLNKYDPPWDSLRYIIGNINCNAQLIEACVEFQDKNSITSTFKVLWFNAIPTNDDSVYKIRAKEYYQCFEAVLKKNNIIK